MPSSWARHAVLTVAEMAEADRLAIAGGTPGIALMEAAGAAVVAEIMRRWSPRPTVVLCGPGNNGGDGFVVARILQDFGWPVQLVRIDERCGSKGDAAVAAQRWSDTFGPAGLSAVELPPRVDSLDGAALVVDAMFGAGLDRPLQGIARDFVGTITARKIDCVAVDMPSGVAGDTGLVLADAADGSNQAPGVAPPCRLTVTFFRAKPGHCLEPARSLCGTLTVAPIGIPDGVLERIEPTCALNDPELWRDRLPRPHAADHKYTRGYALLLGGAAMTGATRLAARAARRIGAGLLTIASPKEAVAIYAGDQAGAIVRPIASDADFERLAGDTRVSALLVGPGAGVSDATRRRALLALTAGRSCVLDADAISSLAEAPEALFRRTGGHCLLTPHEGEFARLFPDLSADTPTVAGKLARARAAAARSGAVVLLKGADTVVAAPDGRAILHPSGPPTLASGGTGDVLAGIALGLLAQGMGPFEAAAAACWFQAEAGRAVGPGLIAEDLPDRLPALLARLS